jgi:DNA-binding SARP family transcriptional activator
MPLHFRLLGDVGADLDGQPLDLGHARQRCVLAVLLVEANRLVSVDEITDRIWARVPNSARDTLYSYLSRLRQALAAATDVTIVRQHGGYLLTVDPAAVDIHRFHQLVAEARDTDDEQAAVLFEEALGLWRGPAFASLDTPWLNTVRHRLDQERLAAELDRNDIAIRLGRHGTLLTGLSALARAHPLDERLAGQLMRALYLSGRPAEALDRYERLRRQLREELGTDPGPPLRQLHQRILKSDAALSPPARPPLRLPPPPVPRQLPAAPRLFTGRTRELAELDRIYRNGAAGPVVVSAVGGVGGVGKTWLALYWAHRNIDRFPDGQLYVDLRGFDPAGGDPTPAATAVRAFLEALGVSSSAIPADLDARVGLYRSLVVGKRILVMLDNARDTVQVTPLLPGSSTCTVLITSRQRLAGLIAAHGAYLVDLDVLEPSEARQLLVSHLGPDRVDAESETAVPELLDRCAGLPLALAVVAARATADPRLPLTLLADELDLAATRLDALDAGELSTNLRAVFSASYQALDSRTAHVFRLLGLALGPDFDLAAAASLTALPAAGARSVLRALEAAHLVRQHLPGRYRMHDLVRLYAAECADREEPASVRHAALRRQVDYYLHTAYQGDRVLFPHREPIELDEPVPGCVAGSLPDAAATLAWFDDEHSSLLAVCRVAAQHGWHQAVWQLAWSMDTYHRRRGRQRDCIAVWQAALAAAQELADPAAQILAGRLLGHAYARADMRTEALEHLHRALAIAEETADLLGQAHTHHGLGWAWEYHGDDQQALTHATHALHLFETLHTPVWEAMTLNAVGWYHARLGHHEEARAHCGRALDLFRQHHNRPGEAATLDSLGYLAHLAGQHVEALTYYRDTLRLYRELGDTAGQADTLHYLGQIHAALDQPAAARHAWLEALDLHLTQHRPAEAESIQQLLSTLGPDAVAAPPPLTAYPVAGDPAVLR